MRIKNLQDSLHINRQRPTNNVRNLNQYQGQSPNLIRDKIQNQDP